MGGRVLLVEDHTDEADLTSILLRRRGFEVDVARSGAAAEELARAHVFDVVISDLHLPDGTAAELIPRLRPFCDAPVVVLSGDPDATSAASEAGAAACLIKPVAIDRLGAALEAAIAGKGAGVPR